MGRGSRVRVQNPRRSPRTLPLITSCNAPTNPLIKVDLLVDQDSPVPAPEPWLSFLLSSTSSSLLPLLLKSGMNNTIACLRRKYFHVTEICEQFNVVLLLDSLEKSTDSVRLSYMGEVD